MKLNMIKVKTEFLCTTFCTCLPVSLFLLALSTDFFAGLKLPDPEKINFNFLTSVQILDQAKFPVSKALTTD